MPTKVKLNNKGFRALRTSADAVALVHKEAERLAGRAGDGFDVLPLETPRNRAHAVVAPVTVKAARDNSRNNTLLRALGGARR